MAPWQRNVHGAERIALLPLTPEQVEIYLQRRIPLLKDEQANKDWTYYRDQVNRIPGFSDLTTRPVLLEMIVKTLPELVAQHEEINRASLYNRYLQSKVARQREQKQRRLLIRQEDRFHLMQVIARHFYKENPPGLTAEHIQSLLKDEFSSSQRGARCPFTRFSFNLIPDSRWRSIQVFAPLDNGIPCRQGSGW